MGKRNILPGYHSYFRYLQDSWYKRARIYNFINRHGRKRNETWSEKIPDNPRNVVLGSDNFLFCRGNNLFNLQYYGKPHGFVVFRCSCVAHLRIFVYPNFHKFFWIEKTACFYCNKLSFDMPSSFNLRNIYQYFILGSDDMHRCSYGVFAFVPSDIAGENKGFPLEISAFLRSGFCSYGSDDFPLS